jgi:hypothetical protein
MSAITHLRESLIRAPAIIGSPYNKRPFVEMYFHALRLAFESRAEMLEHDGQAEMAAEIRAECPSLADPAKLADAFEGAYR